MNWVNRELTEAEIRREEALLVEYAALTEDTCPACGCKMGGPNCQRCGSAKVPVRATGYVFSTTIVSAKAEPPAVVHRDLKPDNALDIPPAPISPKPSPVQAKHVDTRPVKPRPSKSTKAQGGLFG